jgi:hypothetical protein
MAGVSLSQIGSSGIQTGLEQAQRAALQIAQAGVSDADRSGSALTSLAEASVDLLEAKNLVQASAKVVATGDELLGTIIDTIA